MLASRYGREPSGHGKFWAAGGTSPEAYTEGPFASRAEAEVEARLLLGENGYSVATVGRGEEVELHLPDADDVIERMTDGLYEQCGEVCDDYLYPVPTNAKRELTEAVERAVADWLTKYNLWPTFCKVKEVGTVRLPECESSPQPVFTSCQVCGRGLNSEDLEMNNGMCIPCANE